MSEAASAKERARRRRDWPVAKRTLRTQHPATLPPDMSTAGRWAATWELAVAAWAFQGVPLPDYSRGDTPLRLLRAGDRRED